MTARTYWISKKDQVVAVVNPIRHDIIDRLTALGPMNVRVLALALGKQPTAIYRHLKLLEDVGLVKVKDGSQGERGRPSSIYYPIAKRIRLARAVGNPALKKQIAGFARMAGSQAARDYNSALGGKRTHLEGAERNHWLFRVVIAPSPKKLRRINQLLDELAELAWSPELTSESSPGPSVSSPESPPDSLISMAWFLSPVGPSASKRAASRRDP